MPFQRRQQNAAQRQLEDEQLSFFDCLPSSVGYEARWPSSAQQAAVLPGAGNVAKPARRIRNGEDRAIEHYLANRKAYFQEVDAFKLAEEPELSKTTTATQTALYAPGNHVAMRQHSMQKRVGHPLSTLLESDDSRCLTPAPATCSDTQPVFLPQQPDPALVDVSEALQASLGARDLHSGAIGERAPASSGSNNSTEEVYATPRAWLPATQASKPLSEAPTFGNTVLGSAARVHRDRGASFGLSRRTSLCISHTARARRLTAEAARYGRQAIDSLACGLAEFVLSPIESTSVASGQTAEELSAVLADSTCGSASTMNKAVLPAPAMTHVAEATEVGQMMVPRQHDDTIATTVGKDAKTRDAERVAHRALSTSVLQDLNDNASLGPRRHVKEATRKATGIVSSAEDKSALHKLLQLCKQPTDVRKLPTMDKFLRQHTNLRSVKKIGEGTFGEAFKGASQDSTAVVFKIVPMEGHMLVNGEPQKQAHEILAEVLIAQRLSALGLDEAASDAAHYTDGFVQTHCVGVCRGKYASILLQEWRRWDSLYTSENECVDCFGKEQLYMVFVVADGGTDLDHYSLRNFQEARSLLLQACLTLAVGEAACEFEHRDLHWGNLLVRPCQDKARTVRLRGVDILLENAGVHATLIDFTLSRLSGASGDEVIFCNLEQDPELFEGPKAHCQSDTYRRMRSAVKGQWQQYCPKTNCMWLHYLADVMLQSKSVPYTIAEQKALRGFRKRSLHAPDAGELLWDELFVGLFTVSGGVTPGA